MLDWEQTAKIVFFSFGHVKSCDGSDFQFKRGLFSCPLLLLLFASANLDSFANLFIQIRVWECVCAYLCTRVCDKRSR